MSQTTKSVRISNSMQQNVSLPAFFNLDTTMETEQCPASQFLWRRASEKAYFRAYKIGDRFYKVEIKQTATNLAVTVIPQMNKRIYPNDWGQIDQQIRYQFRLDDDYETILDDVKRWPEILRLFERLPGIRLMRDVSVSECIVTSICSQNTSIQHLNRMMNSLMTNFGATVVFSDSSSITMMPDTKTIAQLDVDDLQACGLGYRAKYLLDSSKLLLDPQYKWSQIADLPKDEAELSIRKLPGVGQKVGALILSFGFGRTDVFAVDVWAQKGLFLLYGWRASSNALKRKAEARFGSCAAYINTYVFHAFRKDLSDDVSGRKPAILQSQT